MTTKNKQAKLEGELQCPLCGYRFRREETKTCQTCPVQKYCGLIMCPRCNHEFPKP